MDIVMLRHMRLASVAILGLLLVCGTAPMVAAVPSASQTYTLIDLNFGGNFGGATAINEQGHVLATRGHHFDAYPSVWQSGVGWTSLPDPLKLLGITYFRADGRAINNHGAVVGSALNFGAGNGSYVGSALLWQADSVSVLRPPRGATRGEAYGINDRNQVVGWVADGAGTLSRAVIWQPNGSVHELGTLPGASWSSAVAINARGAVAGSSGNHAFVWEKQRGMQDLGTLPGATTSDASGINSQGHVVGTSGGHAFLWQKASGMQDLGTLPGAATSRATGINDHNQVVGSSGNHAFVWDRQHGMQDLGVLATGYTSSAAAINNLGQIVGVAGKPFSGGDFSTFSTAVLWQPDGQDQDAATTD